MNNELIKMNCEVNVSPRNVLLGQSLIWSHCISCKFDFGRCKGVLFPESGL
jgi:hypothetical protein